MARSLELLVALALGAGLGLGFGLLLGLWRRRGGLSRGLPRARQLLSWMDSSATGWILLDRSGSIGHINPRAERILQLDAGRLLVGQPFTEICTDPELASSIRIARRQDRPQRLEWHSGGQDLDVMVVPGRDGWLGVQLQSRRSLDAQLEQQERWVSDVAHELKTPLTALLLVGDSLAAQVNSQNARLVERLQRELLRLQELVGDLLELSRLENTLPGLGQRATLVDLPPLVEQVWANLRPLADPRGIRLDLQAPAQIQLRGDSSRLHRALLNLLDNALRFSPDGGVVAVSLARRGDWCQIGVADQGAGLSEDDLLHLFERFYRGDPARARGQRTGSGLGLSIVQQIAVTHGGRIQASNQPGGGALLELILPGVVGPGRPG
ncbi:HAMP domain-containing sensor histidine kinase [Cyanobium sp. FACHB-13342]|uniref:sensor histidine kinase n=1 Tax=Cyanobium sp. FACHB-13342 TaxID=2692793 RepID=UPI001F556A23|nr:HAMP domain-containing sensor histidine kinase [Cyanobium sp. FACHB-13342]